MNLFKRTKSIINKNSAKQPEPSPAPTATSTQPRVTYSNADLHSSQVPSGDHIHSESPKRPNKPTPTRIVGAKISHRDASDDSKAKSTNSFLPLKQDSRASNGSALPPNSIPLSTRSNFSDMYTQNDLHTFSFGAAPANPSSSSLYRPIDPLSRRFGEGDSDEISTIPDTTPRPSVVGKQQSCTRNSQPSGLEDFSIRTSSPRRTATSKGKARAQDSDTASSHTFGTSSASLSSVSGPGADSRTTSLIGGYSSATPLTSSNDMTSDDDDDMIGRHPISSLRRTAQGRSNATPDQDPLAEFSEEEFDQDAEEIDDEGDFGGIANGTNFSHHKNESKELFASGRRGSKSIEDLHSTSFLKDSEQTSLSLDQRPLPPTPTSLPGSLGDWLEARTRSHRDKDLPNPGQPQNPASSSNGAAPHGSSVQDSSATAEFDWMIRFGATGLVGFDASEMTDIVGPGNLSNSRGVSYPFHRGSTSSAPRRQSSVSSTDMLNRNINGWSNSKHREQQQYWTFKRQNTPADANGRRRVGDKEKDRSGLTTMFASRPSTSSGYTPGPSTAVEVKSKPHKEPWCGQRLGSTERWVNAHMAFSVSRKNIEPGESGKPLQQRLSVSYRSPGLQAGPGITIHKHSKAAAFSISRAHRATNPNTAETFPGQYRSTRQGSSQGSAHVPRKKSDMTLLATTSVQCIYYSTNTTRKLDTHGLLDENNGRKTSELENERHGNDRERNRAKGKGKEKLKPNVEAYLAGHPVGFTPARPQDIATPQERLPDSAEGSSAGSISNVLSSGDSGTLVDSSTPMTTPEQSQAHGSVGSIEQSIRSQETTSSDRTVIRTNGNRIHHRKRGIYDVEDDDFDEHNSGSDESPRYPKRTPHRETYAALPPEVFESNHHDHPSGGLLRWGRSKGNDRHGNRVNAYLENAYNPPWPVTVPRSNQENRQGIVDDLNTSFQDVGLLPAIGEVRGSSSHSGQHKHKRDQNPKKKGKLQYLPRDDVLYMVLPLWPSETDPTSSVRYPFEMPPIPMSDRQYLVISYNPFESPVREDGKSKSGEKKRSQDAPASEGGRDSYVFYDSFRMSARMISYQDLQGSGIRIPENGLTVSGPLREAYDSIPGRNHKGETEPVIGTWFSRDKGVEFISEGFEALGLTRTIPNPHPMEPSEDDDSGSLDTIAVLTPIGRAVMEMAWLGCLAVNSFNPHSHLY